MIWHYDMITGDEIDVEEPGQTTRNITSPEFTPMPRLMTVQEDTSQPRVASVSPAIVMLPVETLLAR